MGCAHGDLPPRTGLVETQNHYYIDDQGLSVWSSHTTVDQPVAERLDVTVEGITDQVVIRSKAVEAQRGAEHLTGHDSHFGVDAVSSASVSAGNPGGTTEEWRYQGNVGLRAHGGSSEAPVQASVQARGSHEPDYDSVSGLASGSWELNERNNTLTAFAGYGKDWVEPDEPPPGEATEWPAQHQRVFAGATFSQVLNSSSWAGVGVSTAFQAGKLESPYRRAVVQTTLFPEAVPETRNRWIPFAQCALHLGWRSALHLRQGFYADTWGVRAIIPELVLRKSVGADWLVSVGYRFYHQWPASFYSPLFEQREEYMSGDSRLGTLTDHSPSVTIRWQFLRNDEWGSMNAQAGYRGSILRYVESEQRVQAHVSTLSLGWNP